LSQINLQGVSFLHNNRDVYAPNAHITVGGCPAGYVSQEGSSLHNSNGASVSSKSYTCQVCPEGKFGLEGTTECEFDHNTCPKNTFAWGDHACER